MNDFSETILLAILGLIGIELLDGWIGITVGILTSILLILKIISEIQKQIERRNEKKSKIT